jgi:hypothetical protein
VKPTDPPLPASTTMAASQEAYDLALLAGESDQEALRTAIATALRKEEPAIVQRAVSAVQTYANEFGDVLDEEGNPGEYEHYYKALNWAADKLGQDLPTQSRTDAYEPADGDIVQVLIDGTVRVEADPCGHCGKAARVNWMVTTELGDEYRYDMDEARNLTIHKIASGE